MSVLPARERKGTTTEMLVIEHLWDRAVKTSDYRLARFTAAAWTILGWYEGWLATSIPEAPSSRMLENASGRRPRALVRAEARGFVAALQALQDIGILSDEAYWAARHAEADARTEEQP